ncbi:hypothetical protein ACWGPZ_26415 [Priestia megaterium]
MRIIGKAKSKRFIAVQMAKLVINRVPAVDMNAGLLIESLAQTFLKR